MARTIFSNVVSGKTSETSEACKAVVQLYAEAAEYWRAAKLRDPWRVGTR